MKVVSAVWFQHGITTWYVIRVKIGDVASSYRFPDVDAARKWARKRGIKSLTFTKSANDLYDRHFPIPEGAS